MHGFCMILTELQLKLSIKSSKIKFAVFDHSMRMFEYYPNIGNTTLIKKYSDHNVTTDT